MEKNVLKGGNNLGRLSIRLPQSEYQYYIDDIHEFVGAGERALQQILQEVADQFTRLSYVLLQMKNSLDYHNNYVYKDVVFIPKKYYCLCCISPDGLVLFERSSAYDMYEGVTKVCLESMA